MSVHLVLVSTALHAQTVLTFIHVRARLVGLDPTAPSILMSAFLPLVRTVELVLTWWTRIAASAALGS
jgi:hypothetical protein